MFSLVPAHCCLKELGILQDFTESRVAEFSAQGGEMPGYRVGGDGHRLENTKPWQRLSYLMPC